MNVGKIVLQEEQFITERATALGWGDDPYWLGLRCKDGENLFKLL